MLNNADRGAEICPENAPIDKGVRKHGEGDKVVVNIADLWDRHEYGCAVRQ